MHRLFWFSVSFIWCWFNIIFIKVKRDDIQKDSLSNNRFIVLSKEIKYPGKVLNRKQTVMKFIDLQKFQKRIFCWKRKIIARGKASSIFTYANASIRTTFDVLSRVFRYIRRLKVPEGFNPRRPKSAHTHSQAVN